jgi:hypothetical protein
MQKECHNCSLSAVTSDTCNHRKCYDFVRRYALRLYLIEWTSTGPVDKQQVLNQKYDSDGGGGDDDDDDTDDRTWSFKH